MRCWLGDLSELHRASVTAHQESALVVTRAVLGFSLSRNISVAISPQRPTAYPFSSTRQPFL